jgi:glycosyltransferase involved in cell wall biosynthesis
MFTPRYDLAALADVPRALRPFYGAMPAWMRLACELHRRRGEYDALLTWGERMTLALLGLQRLSGRAKPHVAIIGWPSKANVGVPLRLLARGLQAIITTSSVQRTFAIDHLHFPAERIFFVRHFVDQVFWSPRPADADRISSAGQSMRDYPTLLAALRETDIPCHVATRHVRVNRGGPWHTRKDAAEYARTAPRNVAIGARSLLELRDLYARSRFVVVPLLASDSDNGVTVILEAMAMGKPVICSRTKGQVDVIEDGVTGILVPVGDPLALKEAMLALWNDPARALAMGRKAREQVERFHRLESFCAEVWRLLEATLGEPGAATIGSRVRN